MNHVNPEGLRLNQVVLFIGLTRCQKSPSLLREAMPSQPVEAGTGLILKMSHNFLTATLVRSSVSIPGSTIRMKIYTF